MRMRQPKDAKYFFSPTLLDSFNNYLNADKNWDKFYGDMDEDNEKYVSIADYEQKQYDELIDRINRKPHEPSEAATRGTCFNDLVDTLLHSECCGKTQFTRLKDANGNLYGIRCVLDGFTFDFDINLCNTAAVYFGKEARCGDNVVNTDPSDKCCSQVLVESTIDTIYGVVNLYGFIDEMRRDIVYDIKTTSRYEFGKYESYNQRFVYPYCLIESGMVEDISQFEFTAYALRGGTKTSPLITGVRYSEVYDYNHEDAKRHIKSICERFIEFIEANKDKITDKNIFTWHEHKH